MASNRRHPLASLQKTIFMTLMATAPHQGNCCNEQCSQHELFSTLLTCRHCCAA